MGIGYRLYLPHLSQKGSFEELDDIMIFMGDDHTCQLVCKGTVRIRMYLGTLIELKEVRHIPSMMKNIISVGALEVKGIKEILREGTLKMSSGLLLF